MKSKEPTQPSEDVPPTGQWWRDASGRYACLVARPRRLPLRPTQFTSRAPSQPDRFGLPISIEPVLPHPVLRMLVHAGTFLAVSPGPEMSRFLCNDSPGSGLMPGAAPEPSPTASRSLPSTSESGFSCHAARAVGFFHMSRTEHLSALLAWAILPEHSQGTSCFHRLVVAGGSIFGSWC